MSDKDILFEYLKRKTYKEAQEICKEAKFTLRVVKEDGNYKIVTRDYRLDRINLELENNIITKVYIG